MKVELKKEYSNLPTNHPGWENDLEQGDIANR